MNIQGVKMAVSSKRHIIMIGSGAALLVASGITGYFAYKKTKANPEWDKKSKIKNAALPVALAAGGLALTGAGAVAATMMLAGAEQALQAALDQKSACLRIATEAEGCPAKKTALAPCEDAEDFALYGRNGKSIDNGPATYLVVQDYDEAMFAASCAEIEAAKILKGGYITLADVYERLGLEADKSDKRYYWGPNDILQLQAYTEEDTNNQQVAFVPLYGYRYKA
jgi:hypothetical protein